MQKFDLPVVSVALGTDSKKSYHFLSIKLARKPTMSDKNELCERLVMHLFNHDVSLSREFSEDEMHFRPSKRSEANFATHLDAIEEYRLLLITLGLGEWQRDIIVDGDLRPFAERDTAPPEQTALQHMNNHPQPQ